jgi:hypothetical protein
VTIATFPASLSRSDKRSSQEYDLRTLAGAMENRCVRDVKVELKPCVPSQVLKLTSDSSAGRGATHVEIAASVPPER